MREVRQVGHIGHQALHPRLERLLRIGAALRQAAVHFTGDLGQHPHEVRDVAARVVDVGLEQDRVAGSLVDLDVVLVRQDALELRTVESGHATHQGHAGRIEAELVVIQALQGGCPVRARRQIVCEAALPVLRGHHGVRAENPEIFRDQRIVVDRLADGDRDLDRIGHEPIALELHLASRDVETCDELLVRTGRSVGEYRLLELLLDGVEFDVLDRQHRALPDRGHRLVRRIGLVDAQPDLTRIGDEPGLEQHLVRRILAEFGLLLFISRDRFRVMHPRLDLVGGAHPVRRLRNGEKRAKPNQASSHRKIRSGLIARHSSITRRVL